MKLVKEVVIPQHRPPPPPTHLPRPLDVEPTPMDAVLWIALGTQLIGAVFILVALLQWWYRK